MTPAQNPRPNRVVIVDDDARIRDLLRRYLTQEGFDVLLAEDAKALNRVLTRETVDLIVLDLMLPGEDGLSICRRLRSLKDTTPIIMLTAKVEDVDRIVGLEIGADDYLPKPFEPRELLARVKALLRRATPEAEPGEVLRFGRLDIDLGARQARLDGQVCELTGHQFELLMVLARSPGRVLSRDQIMDSLKGHPMEAFDRSIDVHISRIRALIEDDPKAPRYLQTVRGSGYMLAPD